MGRFIAGAVACLLLVSGGLFWWQVKAEKKPPARTGVSQTMFPADEDDLALPVGDESQTGDGLPAPPAASAKDKEAKRFDRYDRNRDGIITRDEMMGSRVKAFKKLDKDGNNLLSFEEWAVATSDRFGGADANGDGKLSRAEFATTAPKVTPKQKSKCKC